MEHKKTFRAQFGDREEAIREAMRYIMRADAIIFRSSHGLEPFRLSKLFNMMGKELQQQRLVLSALLDGNEVDVRVLELKMHSSEIYKALLKESGDNQ